MPIKGVVEALKKFDNFLITSHIDPEPDALGSELALYELVRKLGKKATIINNEKVSEEYSFLEGVELIKTKPEKGAKFDAALVVDCPNPGRTGGVKKRFSGVKFIVNIDHHISNENFGDENWVDPHASSTAEMIYLLYKEMKIVISEKMAANIYIAILTDTGSFNYSNTSSLTHHIAGELLEYGINPHTISTQVYKNKKYSDMKLLSKVLSTMALLENGKIAYIVCTKDMLRSTKSMVSATENFVNFATSIKGVIIAIFIREEPDKKNCFKISLRSKKDISVNKLAGIFGGGGHKHAAGCLIEGTLSEVKKRLFAKAKDALKSKGKKIAV